MRGNVRERGAGRSTPFYPRTLPPPPRLGSLTGGAPEGRVPAYPRGREHHDGRSMTGYGRGEALTDGLRLAAELRSINHRFCEVSARLPRLRDVRGEARRSSRIRCRGASSPWSFPGRTAASRESREARLAGRARGRAVCRAAPAARRRSSASPERWICARPPRSRTSSPGRSPRAPDFYLGLLRDVVEKATRDLIRMKETEGESLKATSPPAPASCGAAWRASGSGRRARARDAREDEGACARSSARSRSRGSPRGDRAPLDRLDCTEECVRLRRTAITSSSSWTRTAPGRKLNFLLQEMNREINTIGSKSNDVAIVEQVVEVKEEPRADPRAGPEH